MVKELLEELVVGEVVFVLVELILDRDWEWVLNVVDRREGGSF